MTAYSAAGAGQAARVLIAGASRGLGLALCQAYAERGDDVLGTCREPSAELDELGVRAVTGVELTDTAAVSRLPEAVGPAGLDVLVYNAAINLGGSDGLGGLDPEALAREFDVIALGAVRVVLALLPSLHDSAKIMLVGNGRRALNISPDGISYGYRMAKGALLCFGVGLARDLRDRGIAVAIASPGMMNTDMLRRSYELGRFTGIDPARARQPVEVVRLLRDRLDRLTLADSPAWDESPAGEPALPVLEL
jgi:NAD(P)-dependent dehydrogenase (short-subunit alcohol dehydrogenase family)